MHRLIRTLIFCSTLVIVLPCLYLLGDDLLFFQPRWAALQKNWETAEELHMQLPATVRKLIKAAYPDTHLPQQVARLLQKTQTNTQDHPLNKEDSVLAWRTFLWSFLVILHLSETEQIAVVLTEATFTQGNTENAGMSQAQHISQGFAQAAIQRFARPLSKLSEQELSILVAETALPTHSSTAAIQQYSATLLRQIGYGESG